VCFTASQTTLCNFPVNFAQFVHFFAQFSRGLTTASLYHHISQALTNMTLYISRKDQPLILHSKVE